MNSSGIFLSKLQVIDLIRKADDSDKTKVLINKLKHLQQKRNPFYLNLEELDEILKWKLRIQYNRQIKIRKLNTDENVRIITRATFAITHHDNNFQTVLRLKLLATLCGVEVPAASAILTLCFPTLYSVVDFRNWRQIYPQSKEKTSYTPKDYINYLQIIRQLSEDFDVTPQEIDMAIWQLDIDKNKNNKSNNT